jgi:hypothetical protein
MSSHVSLQLTTVKFFPLFHTVVYKTSMVILYDLLQVLNEDLRLVLGQQERMINGANVWNWPVSYDKLGIRYRLWRDAIERGANRLPFNNQSESGS